MTKFPIDLNVGNRFWTPKGLGALGMEPAQAIAELVANSLDWRSADLNADSVIQIILSSNSVEVRDNGVGMTAAELQSAIQVSVSNDMLRPNLRVRKGMFGMGMKVACLSLGWKIIVQSRSAAEKNKEHVLVLNTRELDTDGLANNYRNTVSGETSHFLPAGPLADWKSGTSVLIEDLSHRQLTAIAVRDALQEIFSPEINVEQVKIVVIDAVAKLKYICQKIEVPVYAETVINLEDLDLFINDEITGKPVKIKGWLGLMKTSSSGSGRWGLHLFKNNQVIERYHQLPSRLGGLLPKNPHPKFGRTYGEIHLDMCVPSFHKVGFDYSKESWKKAAEVLGDSIQAIMDASDSYRVNDNEKAKEAIKKVQKHNRAIRKARVQKKLAEPADIPDNAILLPTGEWFILVDPIINKLSNSEKNKPWIYHYRKESKELAIIINEDSPIYTNLITGDSDDQTISLLISWAISDCILLLLHDEFHFSFREAVAFRDEQLVWLTSERGGDNA